MDKVIYFSYLLRVWQITREDELVWMASLEDPLTGKRENFASLEDLYAFLLKDARRKSTGRLRRQERDQRKEQGI